VDSLSRRVAAVDEDWVCPAVLLVVVLGAMKELGLAAELMGDALMLRWLGPEELGRRGILGDPCFVQ